MEFTRFLWTGDVNALFLTVDAKVAWCKLCQGRGALNGGLQNKYLHLDTVDHRTVRSFERAHAALPCAPHSSDATGRATRRAAPLIGSRGSRDSYREDQVR